MGCFFSRDCLKWKAEDTENDVYLQNPQTQKWVEKEGKSRGVLVKIDKTGPDA